MGTFLELQIEYLLLLQNFRDITNHVFDWFFIHVTWLGEWIIPLLFIAFIYWIFDKKSGIYLIWNFYTGLLINQFIKVTACIYRPWILDSRVKPLEVAMKNASGYSFPSGHTAIAVGTWGAAAVRFWQNKFVRFSTIILVLLVMLSRNYLGVHTPQDVVVSFIFGAMLLYATSKIIPWVEKGKNRDLAVFIAVAIMCIMLIVYTELKNYPLDYVNGKLLVDPVKMRFESFPKAGFTFGAFLGWFLERRFVKFKNPDGNVFGESLLYLFGAVILYVLQEKSCPTFIQLTNEPCGRFLNCFTIGLYITVIYPLFINIYNLVISKKIKKEDKNA